MSVCRTARAAIVTGRLPRVRIDGRSSAPLLQETPGLFDEVVESGVAAVDDLPRARHGRLDIFSRKESRALPVRGLRRVLGHARQLVRSTGEAKHVGARWLRGRAYPGIVAHPAGCRGRRRRQHEFRRPADAARIASVVYCACALICPRRRTVVNAPSVDRGRTVPSGAALQFCGTAMTRSRRPERVLLTPATPPQRWRCAVTNAMAQ
jgi:hypothetical protein